MGGKSEYYLVRSRAVPETLQKVVEANRLLSSGQAKTVNEAVERAGISRSSYYKFKDDILEFHDSMLGTTLTFSCEINDETGLLSEVLGVIAKSRANLLTIHQGIPVNGVASVNASIQITDDTGDVNELISGLEDIHGVRRIRILGREQADVKIP